MGGNIQTAFMNRKLVIRTAVRLCQHVLSTRRNGLLNSLTRDGLSSLVYETRSRRSGAKRKKKIAIA